MNAIFDYHWTVNIETMEKVTMDIHVYVLVILTLEIGAADFEAPG